MIIRVLNPKRKPKKGVRKMARKRRKNARRRRRNPVATGLLAGNPRRKRRRNPVATGLLAGNPRRRRRKNPRRSYRRRHNPSMFGGAGGILGQLQPMAIGAVGAVALNWVVGKIPGIDQKYKPWAKIGIALIAPRFIKHPAVKVGALVLGALAIKDMIVNMVPQLAGEGELTPDEVQALEGYVSGELGTNVVFGEDADFMGTNVVFGEDSLGADYDM